jgi:hypothetical protein
MRNPLFLSGEHCSLVQRYFSHVFVAFRCSAVCSIVIHLFVLWLVLQFYNGSSVIKCYQQSLHQTRTSTTVFRSSSNAARDFPGRIRHRYLRNSRVRYLPAELRIRTIYLIWFQDPWSLLSLIYFGVVTSGEIDRGCSSFIERFLKWQCRLRLNPQICSKMKTDLM